MYVPNWRTSLIGVYPKTFRDGSNIVFYNYVSPFENNVLKEDQALCAEFARVGIQGANSILSEYGLSFNMADLGFVYFDN